MLNGLDLFSGIGGKSLALAPWVRPLAYCEIDGHAQRVLLARMAEGLLPMAPIWDDIRTFPHHELPQIDVIYGGFPCQDISTMGTKAGLAGERSGLFQDLMRIVEEKKPTFVFLENVSRGIKKEEPAIARAFKHIGYTARAIEVSAFEVGANQERVRWFLLANRDGENVRVSNGRWEREGWESPKGIFTPSWWTTEPKVSGMAHGIPNRMDRHKCLGNAVVPLQARTAFMRLMGLNDF